MGEHGFEPHLVFGLNPLAVSTAILVLTYAVIIWDRFNRAVVALLGAAVLIVIGALDQAEAVKGIDWNTIGLLTGMMILVAIARRSGVFQFVAIWSAQRVNANPAGILLLLQIVTAVLSALLDNVTTVLLIVSVTLAITEELDVPAYPFLFAEIFASNIGGSSTLVGDPPNILIGSGAGLDFNAFLVVLGPVIVVVMLVQLLIIHLVWGRKLRASPQARTLVMGMNAAGMITDWTLMRQSLVVFALVVLAFILARWLHLEPATIALGGAALLLLLHTWRGSSEQQTEAVHKSLAEVEWITIFFFVGLFIVVHAVEVSGLLGLIADALVSATGGHLPATTYAVLWGSALLSAIIDNIPFVATMIPVVKGMAPAYGGVDKIEPLWWSLSLGACLGGNATLVGASANLLVAGLGERNGVPFRFVSYSLYAVPMTIVSIAICHVYLWWRFF
jgi:Na+/H+ antiporter NhaD/arsenite permease-like protein